MAQNVPRTEQTHCENDTEKVETTFGGMIFFLYRLAFHRDIVENFLIISRENNKKQKNIQKNMLKTKNWNASCYL